MRTRRRHFRLLYRSGDEVRDGDRVIAVGRPAAVTAVLRPGTKAASDHYVAKEGGFLLEFDDGDCQVWPNTEDPIELVGRS
jgi:hypothetical protein